MRFVKITRVIFQFLAFIIFVYQMVEAIKKYMKLETIPCVETKNIVQAKLPEVFLCLPDSDQKDFKAHRDLGYESYTAFLFGKLENSSGYVSWEGNKNLTYEKVVEEIFYSITKNNNDTWMIDGINMDLTQHFTFFNGFCYKLDIPRSETGLTQVEVATRNGSNFQIIVTDPEMALYYAIYSGTLHGQQIKTQNSKTVYYALNVEEIQWMEATSECTSYGEGQTFNTYADCVANEHKKVFRPLLGCKPPWLSAPHDQGKKVNPLKITISNCSMI